MSSEEKVKQFSVKNFKTSENDTGSPQFQVASLTNRISNLSHHMKLNPKDKHSQRGLMMMVGQRRRLLDYLKANALEKYQNLIQALGLRR